MKTFNTKDLVLRYSAIFVVRIGQWEEIAEEVIQNEDFTRFSGYRKKQHVDMASISNGLVLVEIILYDKASILPRYINRTSLFMS